MVECKECRYYFATIASVIVCLAATLLILKTKTEEKPIERNLEIENVKIQPRKVVGLVLARGGSKGLPRKNLAVVEGKTLLARTIQKMKKIKKFDEIWVSTDDAEITKEAERAGALVHARNPATAVDTAPSIVGVQEFLAIHSDVQIVGLVQCTSPFIKSKWILEAYNKMVHQDYDSVFSVTRQRKLRWKLNKDKTLSAVNFDLNRRPRRQDWEGELVETGMFYFATRQVIEGDRLQGDKIGCVEIPSNHSLEIDDQLDLIVARSLASLFDTSN